jgi:hypothetical protein
VTEWPTVAIAGISVVGAGGSALGAVWFKEHFDRRRAQQRELREAYARLVLAVESLSLRVTNNKIAKHPKIVATQSLVSSAKFMMLLTALVLPSFRRRFSTAEVALLAGNLIMPAVPVSDVSPTDLLSAFDAVQAAAVTVELVGSEKVRRLADKMMDATRELVRFTTTSPTMWGRPRLSDLEARTAEMRDTRTRYKRGLNIAAALGPLPVLAARRLGSAQHAPKVPRAWSALQIRRIRSGHPAWFARQHGQRARAAFAHAEEDQRRGDEAVRTLAKAGVSSCDVGKLLGLSFQEVAQYRNVTRPSWARSSSGCIMSDSAVIGANRDRTSVSCSSTMIDRSARRDRGLRGTECAPRFPPGPQSFPP